MGKLGYSLIILSIIGILGYGCYTLINDLNTPIFIKIITIGILLGSSIIIISQIIQRRKELKEENDSRKY